MTHDLPQFSNYRQHLQRLFRAALLAADPAEAVRRHWDARTVADAERIYIVGSGKGGVAMANAAAQSLGPRLTAGVMAVPVAPAPNPLKFIQSGHPKPDSGSLQAGEAIAALLAKTSEHDLVVALISGGGSALLEKPVAGLRLAQLQNLSTALMRAGATITELNCVRKHLSQIKGGGLARMAAPARVETLILSDVVGDPLDVIASGPTVGDATTVANAQAIVSKYLDTTEFKDVLSLMQETPKPDDPIFARVRNRLIGSNQLAREAAAEAAQNLGFSVTLPAESLEGEAKDWGASLKARLAKVPAGTALIYGGETTVTVKGNGIGGRNHELALAAALALENESRQVALLSAGTDGIDGLAPAAGAMATPDTLTRAQALGLDAEQYLANNDSYSFFKALDDCVVTGPTGTNVNDLVIVLVYNQ
jgi:glycerate 2-kinase